MRLFRDGIQNLFVMKKSLENFLLIASTMAGLTACSSMEEEIIPVFGVESIRVVKFSEKNIQGEICDLTDPPDIYLSYFEYKAITEEYYDPIFKFPYDVTTYEQYFEKTAFVANADTSKSYLFQIKDWTFQYPDLLYTLTLLDDDPNSVDDTVGIITFLPSDLLINQPDSAFIESNNLGAVLYFSWE